MIIEMTNTSKEMFTSDFILTRKGEQIGRIQVQGHLGSVEGKIDITFFENGIQMQRCRKRDVKKHRPDVTSLYRPYNIFFNEKMEGYVYQTRKKTGFLKGFEYHKLFMGEEEYECYVIGMGDKGVISIYNNGVQQAQIEKTSIVFNDLHHYRIYCKNETILTVALPVSVYCYIIGAFHPGVKAIGSEERYYYLDKEQELIEKYDPDFIKTIEE